MSLAHASSGSDAAWSRIVAHADTVAQAGPSRRWSAKAEQLVRELDAESFQARLREMIELIPGETSRRVSDMPLRGVLLAAHATAPDEASVRAVGRAARRCYARVPGRGPRAQRIGNLCVATLAAWGLPAAGELEALAGSLRSPSLRGPSEHALGAVAAAHGVTPSELSELCVPDYGLDGARTLRRTVGEATAEIKLTDHGSVQLRWVTAEGARQKTAPASVRRDDPESVAALVTLARDVARMVVVQRERAEGLLREEEHGWEFVAWRARYMEHPVVSVIAQRLIWRLRWESRTRVVIELDGGLVDVDGVAVRGAQDAQISLWHPLADPSETVLAWRRFLEARGVRQPFKQAHREVFRAGSEDGPRGGASTRFAGHIVRQQQFAALCRRCQWSYALQGSFWSPPSAQLTLATPDRHAMLDVTRVQPHDEDYGIDPFVTIGKLRFTARGKRGGDRAVALSEVPPAVFSEVVRDVALFVAVAGIATTPSWRDAPEPLRRYYQQASFCELGESGQIRHDFLAHALERFPRHDRLSLDDRALVVQGQVASYRIHLETAQVLRSTDGLPIVLSEDAGPRTRPEIDALLPFDDATLLIVLHAALLLVDDHQIEDPLLRVQIQQQPEGA